MDEKLDKLILLNDRSTKQYSMGTAYCNAIVESLVETSVFFITWLGGKNKSKKTGEVHYTIVRYPYNGNGEVEA